MWGKEKLGPILRKHGYAASNAEAPGVVGIASLRSVGAPKNGWQ